MGLSKVGFSRMNLQTSKKVSTWSPGMYFRSSFTLASMWKIEKRLSQKIEKNEYYINEQSFSWNNVCSVHKEISFEVILLVEEATISMIEDIETKIFLNFRVIFLIRLFLVYDQRHFQPIEALRWNVKIYPMFSKYHNQ